jgi:hypothetical protein
MRGDRTKCSVRCDTDSSQAPISSCTVQQNSCSNVMRSVSCKTSGRERRWVAPTATVSAPDAADSRAHKEEQTFRVCAGTEHEQTQPAKRSHSTQKTASFVLRAFKRVISGVSLSHIRQPFSPTVSSNSKFVLTTRTMFTAQLANDGPIRTHDYWNKTCPDMQIRTRVLSRVARVFSKRIKKTELKTSLHGPTAGRLFRHYNQRVSSHSRVH